MLGWHGNNVDETIIVWRRSLVVLWWLLVAGCSWLPTTETPVSDNSAVRSLVEQARNERTAGNLTAAAATLERALRIETRNPRLWLELAQVRLASGDPAQAEQLAVRASSWAGDDRSLRAASWQLIAESRTARGDQDGAREATARAQQYQR